MFLKCYDYYCWKLFDYIMQLLRSNKNVLYVTGVTGGGKLYVRLRNLN